MNRLHVKLFAAFLAVILVAVVITVLYVKEGAEQEIEKYSERTERLNMLRMEHWLLGYYSHGEGWDEIGVYIEEMEVLSGQRVILTDEYGVVIADSYGELAGDYFESGQWPSRPLVQPRLGELIGMLHLSPEPTIQTEFARELTQSINKSLLIGSMISVGMALVLTLILSRAIAAPVKELSYSAQRIGRGDFSGEVRIHDKGEFGQLADAFNRMSQDLAKASRARKNLVADIAHELRTPLTNIRGYTEAIQDNVVDIKTALPLIEEESMLLAKLIEDLQELALAEAGGLKLDIRRIDAVQTMKQLILRFENLAQKKGVILKGELPDTPMFVQADENRIGQMVQNLLTNAITHTPAGKEVSIALQYTDKYLQLSVTDEGSGIEPEKIGQVFERFYRTDPSRTRATGGTGLGLTITKYLTQAQGGEITAESMKGKGSRFTIWLPAAVQQEDREEPL